MAALTEPHDSLQHQRNEASAARGRAAVHPSAWGPSPSPSSQRAAYASHQGVGMDCLPLDGPQGPKLPNRVTSQETPF